MVFAGILILFIVFFKFDREKLFSGKNALLPVLATGLIILSGQSSYINSKLLSHKIFIWFGLISYPLYLWHWPLLSFARIIYGEQPSITVRLMLVIISILFSWITVKYIEKPFRFGNQKTSTSITFLCSLMIGIGIFGYFLFQKSDLESLQNETDKVISKAEQLCKQKFPIWFELNDNPCRMQNEDNSIVLVGDSHAGHLYYGLIEGLKETKENVAVFAASCAVPFLNVSTALTDINNIKIRKDNYKLENMAFDYIAKSSSVHTVLLAHNPDCSWGNGNAVDIENRDEKNTQVVLKNGLIRTLSFLEKANKQTIIVLDNPKLPFDPQKCSLREGFAGLLRKDSLCEFDDNSPPRQQFKEMVTEIIAERFPKVKIVDLSTVFCPLGKCNPVVNGNVLYSDSTHLNSFGSKYVAPFLIKAIAK